MSRNKRQRNIHSFQKRRRLTLISLQNIKMKKKKGYKPNEKLMLKLTHKNDYVIDGEMLNWYLASGLKLEDITIKQKLENSKSE